MMIVLCLILIGLFIYANHVDEIELASAFSFVFFITILISVYLMSCLANGRVIDDKIKLIEAQNEEIEFKVEVTVKTYMNFEKETLTDLKPDSYIQLANLYPDLKSNELVQNQIKLYEENNKEITELKEKKIGLSIYRWWLYFGR